jgi:hypothetical protein
VSLWWLFPLALAAVVAAAARLGAARLRREQAELRTATDAIRALTVTVTAARGATRAEPAALEPESGR